MSIISYDDKKIEQHTDDIQRIKTRILAVNDNISSVISSLDSRIYDEVCSQVASAAKKIDAAKENINTALLTIDDMKKSFSATEKALMAEMATLNKTLSADAFTQKEENLTYGYTNEELTEMLLDENQSGMASALIQSKQFNDAAMQLGDIASKFGEVFSIGFNELINIRSLDDALVFADHCGATMISSGTAIGAPLVKFFENSIDYMAANDAIVYTMQKQGEGKMSETDAELYINSVENYVAKDFTGAAFQDFKESEFGQNINGKSYIKYDSDVYNVISGGTTMGVYMLASLHPVGWMFSATSVGGDLVEHDLQNGVPLNEAIMNSTGAVALDTVLNVAGYGAIMKPLKGTLSTMRTGAKSIATTVTNKIDNVASKARVGSKETVDKIRFSIPYTSEHIINNMEAYIVANPQVHFTTSLNKYYVDNLARYTGTLSEREFDRACIQCLKNRGCTDTAIIQILKAYKESYINERGLSTFFDPQRNLTIRYLNNLDKNYQVTTYEQVAKILDELPPEMSSTVSDITFIDLYNPDDFLWEQQYGIRDFRSAATGGVGTITFYKKNILEGTLPKDVVVHEVAHNYDWQYGSLWGGIEGRISESPTWKNAMLQDQRLSGQTGVTSYAIESGSSVEDFAESVVLYYTNPKALDMFPARKALLDEYMVKTMKETPVIQNVQMAAASPFPSVGKLKENITPMEFSFSKPATVEDAMKLFKMKRPDFENRLLAQRCAQILSEASPVDMSVETLIKNFYSLEVEIDSWQSTLLGYNGYYDAICIPKEKVASLDSTTFFHELGHAWFHKTLGNHQKNYEITPTKKMVELISNAQANIAKHDEEFFSLLKKSSDIIDGARAKTIEWWETKMKQPEMQRISDTIDKLYESDKIDEIKDILKDAKISDEDIAKIIDDEAQVKEICIRFNEKDKKNNYYMDLLSNNSTLNDARKTSAMLNSITQSKDDVISSNGITIKYPTSHENSYWTGKKIDGYTEEEIKALRSFDELMADYFALAATGRQNVINELRKVAGDELFDEISATYQIIEEQLLKKQGQLTGSGVL